MFRLTLLGKRAGFRIVETQICASLPPSVPVVVLRTPYAGPLAPLVGPFKKSFCVFEPERIRPGFILVFGRFFELWR